MLVLLQTILGLHPAGALRATRFVPDESVTSMTVEILIQRFIKYIPDRKFLAPGKNDPVCQGGIGCPTI
ncbi:MAG: hypothetical protein A3I78_04620 [Gammaproteobacteria bacterium RIFCSPLOWO2_02_FULL_56_15]|nr:MAG: hypothetical protein A3I78_04620 [Gammaproteobacteria bacterium RIFCSPLOWO2_02_FULL_56_15]